MICAAGRGDDQRARQAVGRPLKRGVRLATAMCNGHSIGSARQVVVCLVLVA